MSALCSLAIAGFDAQPYAVHCQQPAGAQVTGSDLNLAVPDLNLAVPIVCDIW